MSSSGTADVQAELQDYLNAKGINNLFIKIVEALLLDKPDNPVQVRSPSYETFQHWRQGTGMARRGRTKRWPQGDWGAAWG